VTEKTRIIDALGEPRLLLPSLLADALSANERARYYLGLLQTARLHASHPGHAGPALLTERTAAGIADEGLDELPARSMQLDIGLFRIPQAEAVCQRIAADLDLMLEPVRNSGLEAAASLSARLAALNAQAWCDSHDTLSAEQIDRLASADRDAGDSANLLVLDLHKALTQLQARIATENIDGAAAYDIEAADRPLVAAFMRGVNSTRPLKFEHPGLGATATRNGDRLILQNDIGTTDAHVLVVHVEARCVTLTYTDVHIQRLNFFQSLFEHWAVSWDDTRSHTDHDMEDGIYHISIGKFTANNEAGLGDYLHFLGSRLVFLIDWNRARKRLRLLLPKKESVTLLKWAADENLGHMGWLRAGGEQLVFDALAFTARTPPAFGARLDDMLERSRATSFMQFVFRACTSGQLGQQPDEAVRNEIRAELATCFRTARHQMIDVAAEHAALSIEIATGLHDAFLALGDSNAAERIAHNASLARESAQRADERVKQARELQYRNAGRPDFYCSLLESADNVTGQLEKAAFHLGLFPATPPGTALIDTLTSLANLSASGAKAYLKALETARKVRRGGPREDLQDFLESIRHIIAAERQSNDALRSFKRALIVGDDDFRTLYTCAECARNLEAAADTLRRTALQLHDHILATLGDD
jgi:uncharacterized protein Yka (UPF0111/DUF47 family)